VNSHLSSRSRMDMPLQRKLSSVNSQGRASELSKLYASQQALSFFLASVLALVLLLSAYPQSLVAQEQPGPLQTPSGPSYQEQTPEQLQELVAPITQCAFGIIHLMVHGICMDTPTDDCPASMHHSRWTSAWTPMIFVHGTSMKSEIE
jgi:hypothetical protein